MFPMWTLLGVPHDVGREYPVVTLNLSWCPPPKKNPTLLNPAGPIRADISWEEPDCFYSNSMKPSPVGVIVTDESGASQRPITAVSAQHEENMVPLLAAV